VDRLPDSFVIWGAGGHGKVVADLVRACGHQLAGFIDADSGKLGREMEPGGGRVILDQRQFLDQTGNAASRAARTPSVALAIGDNAARQRCLLLLGDWPVPSLVHPSAIVSPSVVIGRGTVVFALAVINAAARIGSAVIINSGAMIEHDCVVSDGAHVSPGAVLAGGVTIGERSWIGAGATIIQGVTIGADVTVGAGSVVLRNVVDGSVVAGVPARPLRTRSGSPDPGHSRS
jgi:sugar O-acyltransferase (sialic acid O-acetyltransferase NeuD family)